MALSDGLVHLWNLESATSPIEDAINGFNLTTVGGSPSVVAAIQGDGVDFDGANDYMFVSGADNDDFLVHGVAEATLSFWVFPRNIGGPEAKTVYWRSAGFSLICQFRFNSGVSTGTLNWTDNAANIRAVSTGSIFSNNNWYHIVGRYRQNDATYLNVNDTLFASSVPNINQETANPIVPNTTTLIFGANPSGFGNKLDGILDQVAIWNTFKSDAEVTSLYGGGSGVDILGGAATPRTMPAGWLRR